MILSGHCPFTRVKAIHQQLRQSIGWWIDCVFHLFASTNDYSVNHNHPTNMHELVMEKTVINNYWSNFSL